MPELNTKDDKFGHDLGDYDAGLQADPQRRQEIMAFSGYLTGILVEAINEASSRLGWRDAAFSAALAIKTVGAVAQIVATKKGTPITDEQIAEQLMHLVAKALSTGVVMTEVGSMEEADAMMDAMTNPQARH